MSVIEEDDRYGGSDPKWFDELPVWKQGALRLWVQLALKPTRTIRSSSFSHSYSLKHYAERTLGWYVSNGELKGAMLAEGYRWERCKGRDNPNWVFNSMRRCPHQRSWAEYRYGQFMCPMADHQFGSHDAGIFPSLCQASAEEIARFDAVCVQVQQP